MAAPPRDAMGRTSPHNDPDIGGEDFVIRHTTPNDLCTEANGRCRLSSGAFSESPEGGMSVDIEPRMIAACLAPLHYVPVGHGAVKLKVGDLRDLGFQVGS